MDKENLDKIVRDPNIIRGIHNYCDRWCERCPKTSHCTVFAVEEAGQIRTGHSDTDNQAFWDQLGGIFAVTRQMLTEWAKENGIDITQPLPEDERTLRDQIDEEAMNHTLIAAAKSYCVKTRQWFESAEDELKQKVARAEAAFEMDLPDSDPEAELWELSDILDIIRWYYMFILVKLRRALHRLIEIQITGFDDGSHDGNGSAKVALIGMDRSLAAWALLRNHLPEHDNAILDFLVQLERLRRQTESLFPNARAFIRTGLDE